MNSPLYTKTFVNGANNGSYRLSGRVGRVCVCGGGGGAGGGGGQNQHYFAATKKSDYKAESGRPTGAS